MEESNKIASSYDDMKVSEAKYIVKRALEAGVTKEVILGSSDPTIWGNYAASPKEEEGIEMPSDIALNFIHKAREKWACIGSFIVIEGLDKVNRDWMAQAFMYRGIVSHAKQIGRLGLTVTVSEIISQSIGMPSRKSAVVDALTNIPCLWIKDVKPTGTLVGGKDSDARVIFEGVLSGREQAGRPTIITIDGVCQDLNTMQEDLYGKAKGVTERYGFKFEEIMSKMVFYKEKAWRFRAK